MFIASTVVLLSLLVLLPSALSHKADHVFLDLINLILYLLIITSYTSPEKLYQVNCLPNASYNI